MWVIASAKQTWVRAAYSICAYWSRFGGLCINPVPAHTFVASALFPMAADAFSVAQ